MTDNNFLTALQAASNNLNEQRQAKKSQTPAPEVLPKLNDDSPVVNFILNRKRIDVLFPAKPSEYILQSLRDAGFHYRPSDHAWYHADYRENREFLRRLFPGSDIELEDCEARPSGIPAQAMPLMAMIPDKPMVPAGGVEIDPPTAPCGFPTVDKMPEPVSSKALPELAQRPAVIVAPVTAPIDTLIELPEFEIYRGQVDRLMQHYGIDSADLMLLSIDALYKATFK